MKFILKVFGLKNFLTMQLQPLIFIILMMISIKDYFNYYEDEEIQIIELPYY